MPNRTYCTQFFIKVLPLWDPRSADRLLVSGSRVRLCDAELHLILSLLSFQSLRSGLTSKSLSHGYGHGRRRVGKTRRINRKFGRSLPRVASRQDADWRKRKSIGWSHLGNFSWPNRSAICLRSTRSCYCGSAVLGAVALGLRDVRVVRVVRGGGRGGGADREPDVESGGRDLEQRAEEHPGSVPPVRWTPTPRQGTKQELSVVSERPGISDKGVPAGFCSVPNDMSALSYQFLGPHSLFNCFYGRGKCVQLLGRVVS